MKNKLKVIKRLGYIYPNKDTTKRKTSSVLCLCGYCGKKVIRHSSNIKRVKSCGCVKNEAKKIHGETNTPIYSKWNAPLIASKKEGVPFYKKWRDFKIFKEWFLENCPGTTFGHQVSFPYTIVRINRKKGFVPTNCIVLSTKEALSYIKTEQYLPDRKTCIKIKKAFFSISREVGGSLDSPEVIKIYNEIASEFKVKPTVVYKILLGGNSGYIIPLSKRDKRKASKALWYQKNKERLTLKSRMQWNLKKAKKDLREKQLTVNKGAS